MSRFLRGCAFAILVAAIALPLALLAGLDGGNLERPDSDGSSPIRARLDAERVRDALMAKPELLLEVFQSLERRQAAASGQRQGGDARQLVQAQGQALFNDPLAPVIGNPKGDVTIVEFFDYRCPYCKQAHSVVNALIAEDPGIRVIHKHLPILGPDSVVAARAALAARKEPSYARFHDALMQSRGSLTAERVFGLAAAAGLDVERLKVDMEGKTLPAAIQNNVNLAESLNIRGTPSYVVGNAIHFGATDAATLRRLVAQSRKQG